MNRLRATRLILQLTLAVMLLGALAPTVSRALAAGRHGPLPGADICSTSSPALPDLISPAAASPVGLAVADAPAGGTTPAPALDHCPFCLPVAQRLGPPPATSVHFFNADSGLAPPDAQVSSFPSPIGRVARARGPPVFS